MNLEIEELKTELEQAMNNPDSTKEDLTKIACNIDKKIEKLYKPKISQEKIEKLLNTEQALIIKKNVKSDLLEQYHNISLVELEILAQNIYDYCCLMVNGIPKQEIVSYITRKGSQYYDKLSEESREKLTLEFDIKFLKCLISKYKIIIKSNK